MRTSDAAGTAESSYEPATNIGSSIVLALTACPRHR